MPLNSAAWWLEALQSWLWNWRSFVVSTRFGSAATNANPRATLLALLLYDGPQGTRCKQKWFAANKKDAVQIKNDRCKQKTNAANKKDALQAKKDALQIKNERCKQKRKPLQIKKTGALQTKRETIANKIGNRCKQKSKNRKEKRSC